MQETSDKPGTDGLEIIEFEQFDTSFAVSPTDEGKTRRRYMTLLAESEGERSQKTRLSDVQLLHVQNTEGASFVLKRLYPVPQDADPFARRGREAALFEEYRNQLAVSQLKGFPDVFGYGVTHAGDPGILMEWIAGQTLRDAAASDLTPPEGRVATRQARPLPPSHFPSSRRSSRPNISRARSCTATSLRKTS